MAFRLTPQVQDSLSDSASILIICFSCKCFLMAYREHSTGLDNGGKEK